MTVADSSTFAFLLVDGYDLMGASTELSDPGLEHDTKEILFLGAELRSKRLTGKSSCDIEQSGVFDDDGGVLHETLKAGGKDRVLCWGACGNTIGKHFVGAVVDQVAYDPSPLEADGFVLANARYSCSQHDTGLIIANLAARTTAGNTQASAVDGAASSTAGGVGYLQTTALTLGGYTDLVVKVRHSPDLNSWADLVTFTAATAIGAERKTTATNPIERYLAVSWAWTGSGSDQSATFAVGFARN